MGATASTSHKGKREEVPMWIYTAQVPADQSQDKWGGLSPGMQLLGPNTVARQRSGNFDTDGAMWKKGFSEGKHIFEIVYPVNLRGTTASVGVGLDNAPLHAKGRVSLVGQNAMSWGIDIRTRRSYHNNAIVKRYPQTQVYLPDKFYMYLDVDSGMLQFGSDIDYYGTAITGIPRGSTVYPMVAASNHGASITMAYRGEGDPTRIVTIATTPAGPPMEQPKPREAPPPYTETVTQVPMTREGTNMSKMTEGGPPPPPPTKMSTQQSNDPAGSQLSLKDEKKPEAIPEESKETEAGKETEQGKEAESAKQAEASG